MLSYLTQLQARAVLRDAWIEAEGDPELAEDLFRQAYRKSDDLIPLVCFANELLQHWIDTLTDEPSVVPTADEPMDFDQ